MNGRDRLESIKEQLTMKGSVNVDELQQLFQVSAETIRRDLTQLVEDGIAIRTYGGAVLNKDVRMEKYNFSIRSVTHQEEKQIIAEIAAELIPPYQHIGCDASTTVLELLKTVRDREDLVVLTNSTQALSAVMEAKYGLRSTGGNVDFQSGYMIGHTAAEAISFYNLDMTFVSCKGIDLTGLVYDTNESETDLKRKFIERSRRKILLADHTKIGRKGFTSWAKVWDFDLFVTDRRPPEEFMDMLEENNIEVLYAES
ncbi:MAG: DeoR/GlpR transcriptional regulator [Lachnospiraceae bacterium]|nr:DeoR/GlpR transcriptional regulator [Lachnospiraceae bacterium]